MQMYTPSGPLPFSDVGPLVRPAMDQTSTPMHTTLSRSWLLKTGAFLVLLLVFGVWGTVDAYWLYPKRGLGDASYQFRNFLAAADAAGKLTENTITIAEPKAALAELEAKEGELRSNAKGDSSAARDAALSVAKLDYLSSLSRTWRLNPDPKPLGETTKPEVSKLVYEPATGKGFRVTQGGERTELSARALGERLDEFWKANKPPTPLSGFDMAFQYVFMAVGFGGGLWLIMTMLKAAATAKKITWDAGAKRLGLPGGASIAPDDLQDIDKREWHKYFCTLITKGGSSHRVDLLRYQPLEEWVLELERTVFPDRATTQEKAQAALSSDDKSPAATPNT
jgi:hypothetical protein